MKRIITLLLVALLCLTVVACDGKPGKDTSATPGPGNTQSADNPKGTLTVGITEASGLFNPLYYSSAYDGNVVDLVFDALLTRNYDGELVTSAAESYTISEDGKDITFILKEGLKFSDGQPVKASDVVFTYKMLSDPSYDGRYSNYAVDLLGYDDYSGEKSQEFKGVEAKDDRTVVFHFREALRTNLENCGMKIMPEHYYGEGVTYGDISKNKEKNSQPMGSGPYKMVKFQEKEYVSLERNMLWNGGGYQIKNILMKFVNNITDIDELMEGQVDLLPGAVEPTKIKTVMDSEDYTYNEYARSGYGYVRLNCEYGPTAEKAVRQALFYSFNVQEFVNNYYKLEGTDRVLASVQYHPFSQLSWVLDDEFKKELPNYSFNLDKAKQLLDDAGWTVNPATGYREKDGKTLELKVLTMPDHDILATLVPMWKRDWEDGLKIKLNIESLEFNTIVDYVVYNSDANVDKWNTFFLASTMNTPDPHVMYPEFHSTHIGSGMDNTSRYRNETVDRIFDEAKAIFDVAEAKKKYQEAAKIIADEVPLIPVYANTYFDLYSKKLQNFKTSSLYDWAAAMKYATVAG